MSTTFPTGFLFSSGTALFNPHVSLPIPRPLQGEKKKRTERKKKAHVRDREKIVSPFFASLLPFFSFFFLTGLVKTYLVQQAEEIEL